MKFLIAEIWCRVFHPQMTTRRILHRNVQKTFSIINCPQKKEKNLNFDGSFFLLVRLKPCLRKNLPCMSKSLCKSAYKYRKSAVRISKTNFVYLTNSTEISIQIYSDSSLFINCGGKSVVVDGTTYKDDSSQIGTSSFGLSDDGKWAYSSTGDFVGNENADYIARNTSKLTLAHPELYTEARLSPLSLKYYDLCMENGEYMVKLHFAEIVFTEDHTYNSNGKRVFDVFIQV
jgi:hypothetical protein